VGFLFNQSLQKAGLKFNYTYGTLIPVVPPKASQLLAGWFSVAREEEGTERVLVKARHEEGGIVLVIFNCEVYQKRGEKTFVVCIFHLLFHNIVSSQNTFAARSVQ